MNRAVRAFAIFAAAAVMAGNMSITVCAEDIAVYDAANFATFKNRTAEEVASEYSKHRYAAQTYDDGDRSTYYKTPASLSAPYAAGVLAEDTHKAMTEMTNFYRWLSGVDPLKNVSENDDKLQAEALMRNFEFNHAISDSSKPADMSSEMWDYGKTCTHNILAWNYTPQGAVTGWLNEGYTEDYGWDMIGHRAVLLAPEISALTFGHSGAISIGRIDSKNNSPREAFSAYPAPGYVPRDTIAAYSTAWGVYLDSSKLTLPSSKSDIRVTIKNLGTGKKFVRSGDTVLLSKNCVTFAQPNDYTKDYFDAHYTDSYSVEIDGVKETGTSRAAKLLYTVKFFDATDLMSGYVDRVEIVKNNYIISKDCASTDYLLKVAAILPKTVDCYAQNGRKIELSIIGSWTLDEANKRFTADIDKSGLPAGITDRNNVIGKAEIHYTISDSEFDTYNSVDIPSTIDSGSTEQIKVYRTWLQTDRSEVFRLTVKSDGSYGYDTHLDSLTSPEFDAAQSALESNIPFHIYNKTFQRSDSGEYIAVFYSMNELFHDVYVTNGTTTVNVRRINEKPIMGDIDDDGQITAQDALNVLRLSSGYASDELEGSLADADGDGDVTSSDALLILRYSVGIRDSSSNVGKEVG